MDEQNVEQSEFEGVWEESLSQEQAKEVTEANLVPKGKWEGQIHSIKNEVVKSKEDAERPHPLDGRRVAKIRVTLYTDEGEKSLFIDAIPAVVKATSKSGGQYTRQESTNGGYFYAATKMYGKPFSEVLQYATENRLVYEVGIKKATDEYKAQNTLRGITAVREA